VKRSVLVPPVFLLSLLVFAPTAAAREGRAEAAASTGTLAGVIRDATTNRPVAHVLVTVGYLTPGFQRAAETDAHGRYAIMGLPPTRSIDTYAFAPGYIYHHGVNQTIRAGRTTTYSYSMPRDNYPLKHPRILSFYGQRVDARTARFGMVAVQGTGPFSFEMLAIAPQLGRLVVLAHGAGHHYDGILHVPARTKPGTYRFYYVATQENCFENKTFPHQDVHL
jgi:Carboxypeptidase regulatory-like domain